MRVEEKERYRKVRRVAVVRKRQIDSTVRESKAKQETVQSAIAESRKRFQSVLSSVQKRSRAEKNPRVSFDTAVLAYQNLLEIKQEGAELSELSLTLINEQRPLLVELQKADSLVSLLEEKIEAIQLEQDEQIEGIAQDDLVELQSAQRSLEVVAENRQENSVFEESQQELSQERTLAETWEGYESSSNNQQKPDQKHFEVQQARSESVWSGGFSNDSFEKLQQDIIALHGVHNVQITQENGSQQLSFDFETKRGEFLSVRLDTFAGSKLRVVVFSGNLSNVRKTQITKELTEALTAKGFLEVAVHFIGRRS